MHSEVENLPDDIPILKGMIASISDEKHRYEIENKLLREQLLLMRSKLYGRKTEKLPSSEGAIQEILFDEPAEAEEKSEKKEKEEVIEVPAHTRKKSGRKPLPADLPRVEVIHDLKDEDKICGCGHEKVRIGEERSEQLDIIPAKMQVIVNIRYKYACKGCGGTESEGPAVQIAPAPEQIIPKSIATPGLLAHIFTAKFVDAMPFYRQEKQFERLGVEISRTSMSSWAIKVAEQSTPIMDMLHTEMLLGPLINIDETTVQVLGEQDRPNQTKSYMWVARGGPPKKPVLIYQYHPTRAGEVAEKYLEGYKGYVQTDGYAGYNFLDEQPGVVHVGCWAHVRRKFMDVIKAQGKNRKAGSSDVAIEYIRKLYKIEKDARIQELGPEDLCQLRQQKAKPILEDFKAWLDKKKLQTPPKGLVGKAVAYTLGQWDRLIRYIDSGLLSPDNNLVENAIRPFAVGRRNWLFSGNPEGAKASAILYSLIETAKANALEPYMYLRHLFERLPFAYTAEEYKALMPQNIDPTILAINS
jgi:transposase